MFLVAKHVFRDKAVCLINNFFLRTEIVLHPKHFCTGVILRECQQCFGIRCTEAVNTLVLISDHKKLIPFSGNQTDNFMLYSGGVLCLIHQYIRVPVLEVLQRFRALFKDRQGIDHLIIKVHPAFRTHFRLISPVDLGKLKLQLLSHLFDFLRTCHTVFNRRNGNPNHPEITFCRILLLHFLINPGK